MPLWHPETRESWRIIQQCVELLSNAVQPDWGRTVGKSPWNNLTAEAWSTGLWKRPREACALAPLQETLSLRITKEIRNLRMGFFIQASNLTEMEPTHTCQNPQYFKIRQKYKSNLCLLILVHSFFFFFLNTFDKVFFFFNKTKLL